MSIIDLLTTIAHDDLDTTTTNPIPSPAPTNPSPVREFLSEALLLIAFFGLIATVFGAVALSPFTLLAGLYWVFLAPTKS